MPASSVFSESSNPNPAEPEPSNVVEASAHCRCHAENRQRYGNCLPRRQLVMYSHLTPHSGSEVIPDAQTQIPIQVQQPRDGDGDGRRPGLPAEAAHRQTFQARGTLWVPLPGRRLRVEEPGQLRDIHRLPAGAIQIPVADRAHPRILDHLAPVLQPVRHRGPTPEVGR